jgi:hypothetical protein
MVSRPRSPSSAHASRQRGADATTAATAARRSPASRASASASRSAKVEFDRRQDGARQSGGEVDRLVAHDGGSYGRSHDMTAVVAVQCRRVRADPRRRHDDCDRGHHRAGRGCGGLVLDHEDDPAEGRLRSHSSGSWRSQSGRSGLRSRTAPTRSLRASSAPVPSSRWPTPSARSSVSPSRSRILERRFVECVECVE